MNYKTLCKIRADHPCLAGHFPDDPIVPAVVILDEVISALIAWNTVAQVEQISAAKFLSPIKPEQAFDISLSESSPGRIVFKCSAGDTIFATGKISLK